MTVPGWRYVGALGAGALIVAFAGAAPAAPVDRFTQPYAAPAAPIPSLPDLLNQAEAGRAEAQYQVGLAYQLGLGVARNFDQARLWFGRAAQQDHARGLGGLAFLLLLGQGGPRDLPEAERLLRRAAEQGEASALANLAELTLELHPDMPQQAVDLLDRAIAAGAVNARYRLARLLIEGRIIAADHTRGLQLLESAVAAGNPYALTYLAWLLSEGQVVGRNEKRALALAKQAADAGLAEGLNELGRLVGWGIGIARDPRRGAGYLAEAARLGDPNGWYNLALLHAEGVLGGVNEAEARRLAILAAERGHLLATGMAGRMLYRGEGGPANAAAALPYLRRAAANGDADAQNYLALTLFNGEGGAAMDRAAAMDWWERAVDQGHGPAASNFATYLAEGQGRPADPVRARSLLAAAAERNYAPAQFRWALWQEQGWLGTQKDLPGAIRWFRRAAEVGHAAAAFKYAGYVEAGEGVAADPAEAARWYRRGAEGGNAAAQFQIARLLFAGEADLKADPEAAHGWLERAARQGYGEALFVLGDLSFRGEGRPADPVAAWAYFRLAEEQGMTDAEPNRRYIESRLLPAERLKAAAAARHMATAMRRERNEE